jgi:beta-N-acetylhexosaminidase
MATLGRSGDARWPSVSRARWRRSSKAVGITLDYAPVLDIHTNPKNPVIGDRALAEKADDVARAGRRDRARAAGGGHRRVRQAFPGHGDTSTDSHLELPLVEHPPDRLRAVEFVPFRRAIEAGVATIMTAHVLVPSLDESGRPRCRGASSTTCCGTS